MDAKNSQAKLKRLAAFVRENPGDSFSKFALALEFLKQEQYHKACILFEDIHTKDPDYVGVYYHLGRLYEDMQRLQDARQIYREGITVAEKANEQRTLSELREALNRIETEIKSP